MLQANKFVYFFISIVVLSLTAVSCKKETGPRFAPPSITINGEDSIDLSPGETAQVKLQLNGDGGAKSVVVMKNGGFLREFPIHATATEFIYTTEAVPAGMNEGDEVRYSFLLANNDNIDSSPVPFVIKVALYDKALIGTTELYNLNIGSDGIVPSGTEVKLIKNRNYFLPGPVTFATGSKLIIEEGVHVYMNADAAFDAGIDIQGEANITGTATAPVVLTSSRVLTPATPAKAGDWGAFRLTGSGATSGNGKVSYLRLEYGGDRAFRLSDVGAATQIDHVQVFKCDGEGVMITNGDAQLKYIVATDCKGGSYRLGDAYAGKMQFLISVNSEYFAENDDFAIREDASPVIANATILGAGTTASNTHGMRMRANATPKVYNTIIAEFPRRGLRGNDNITITDLNGTAVFAYSYVMNVRTDPYRDLAVAFAGTFDAVTGDRLTNPFFNNVTNKLGSTFTLETIAGIGVADFVPDAEKSSAFNPATLGAFFTAAPFVGAVKNETEDWTKGWVKNPDGTVR